MMGRHSSRGRVSSAVSLAWVLFAGSLYAGCDGDASAPDAALDATLDRGSMPDALPDAAPAEPDARAPDGWPPIDAAPPDPDGAWPEALDLRALFDAYEAGELDVGAVRAALRSAPDAVRVEQLGPVLEEAVVVPVGVTVELPDGLTIAPEGLLALAPGAQLALGPGASIIADGRFYAIGAPDAPVRMGRVGIEGDVIESEGFDTIHLRGGPNALHRVQVFGGDRLLTVSHAAEGARTRIVGAELDHWVDVALDLPRAQRVELRDSRVGLASAPDEGGEMVRTRGGGAIRIEGSVFGPRRGYRDAIDLQDCVGEWPVLEGNAFAEGEDDAIDLDRCSAYVIGNHIRDYRPLDLEARNAGINGGGITGDGDIDIVIVGNVIERCYHGIGFKNGARPLMVNNTIVDSNIGVSLYQSAVGRPQPHGVMINNLLAGNRDWLTDAPRDIVLDGRWWPSYNQQDAVQATLEADHNTFASGDPLPPGIGNDDADPRIERPDGWPVPGDGSPALDSARGVDLPPEVIDALRMDLLGHERLWDGAAFVDLDRGALER